jgi:glycosyltransferase involved in cell wall biosynthesis
MMKRVLVVQPSLNPPGGGNAVAAWILQALRDLYRLDVLTWEPIDLAGINRHCGTSLTPADFTGHRISPLMARLTPSHGFSLWKHNQLLRIARRIGVQCDAVIGVNCEADLGPRGIQYVHFPRYADPRLRGGRLPRDTAKLKWYHRSPFLMRLYFSACALASGYSEARMQANLTLVNSDWTGGYFRKVHGGNPLTLYPPVANDFPDVPWEQRERGFVCVGRISPEKRLGMIVGTLSAVRQRGHDVHLHIIGVPDFDRDYLQSVCRLQVQHGDWVTLDLDLSRPALTELLAHHQYGIHGMKDEHFGIAVGEMVNAGCIVFAPTTGGQAEIIGDYPDLQYATPEEAVNRIDAMLRAPTRQAAAQRHLQERRVVFSTAAFMRSVQAIVGDFISARSVTRA